MRFRRSALRLVVTVFSVVALSLFVFSCGDDSDDAVNNGPSNNANNVNNTNNTNNTNNQPIPDSPVEADLAAIEGLVTGPFFEGVDTTEIEDTLDAVSEANEAGEFCRAADLFSQIMEDAQSLRDENANSAERLYVDARRGLHDVIEENGLVGECEGHTQVGKDLTVEVGEQTPDLVRASFEIGSPRMFNVYVDGEIWTGVRTPGFELNTDEPGLPGIPVWRRMVAVPHGADFSLQNVEVTVGETARIDLLPHQVPAVDQDGEDEIPDFGAPPYEVDEFSINNEIYDSDSVYPSGDPCSVREVGMVRDLRLAEVRCTTGSYDPSNGAFESYSRVDFEVRFDGDDAFISEESLDVFEDGMIPTGVVLNFDPETLREIARETRPGNFPEVDTRANCNEVFGGNGEELIILTPPEFEEEAERLENHKQARGLTTTVFDVADGPDNPAPDTFSEIKRLIVTRVRTCEVAPKYVLILGDSDFVPPGEIESDPGPHVNNENYLDGSKADEDKEFVGTDLNYGRVMTDWLPDLAVGRLPVRDESQAAAAIDRIIEHEDNPPTENAYYDTITNPALFQCCRTDRTKKKEKKTIAAGESASITFESKTSTSAGGLPIELWVRQKNEDSVNPDIEVRSESGVVRVKEDDVDQDRQYFVGRSGVEYTFEVTNDSSDSVDFQLVARWHQPCTLQSVQAGTDQRWYIETMEYIRDKMVGTNIPNWERLYTDDSPPGLYAFDDSSPRRYHDGTPLPQNLRPAAGFQWNAGTSDIQSAFNDGRFLIVHRDHGWNGGWASPQLAKWQKPSLTEQWPIVFSMNCSTGLFANEVNDEKDSSKEHFAERMVRDDPAAALAIIAPVRVTGTHSNNQISKGLFDSIWPDVLPNYGSSVEKRRLGDVLQHGLFYMMRQRNIPSPGADPNYAAKQMAYYQLFGDPSLEVRTAPPVDLSDQFEQDRNENRIEVGYDVSGAVITAFQRTKDKIVPIGRGEVENGSASIELFIEPEEGKLVELAAVAEDGTAKLLTGEMADARPVDESAFSASATRIGFDQGIDVFAPVDTQYADQGVEVIERFPEYQSLLTIPMAERDNSTQSDPHAVENQTTGTPPGGEPLGITMRFVPSVTRAGMYVGNALDPRVALLEAYDAEGRLLETARVDANYDVDQFIGVEADDAAIAEVRVRFEGNSGGEMIDDLVFE